MNNLLNTEKALKHWLKNKVTVTTATVVGFLIMGTASFGAIVNESLIITEENILNENIINVENDTKAVYMDKDQNLNFINKGKISNIVKNNSNGILINKGNKVTITNEKDCIIEARTLGNDNTTTSGIDITANEVVVINNGNIEAMNNSKDNGKGYKTAVGIGIMSNKFDISNNGEIKASSEVGTAQGIVVYSKSLETGKITNNGIISTEAKGGAASNPISIMATIKDQNTLEIENNGVIESKRIGKPGNLGAIFIQNDGQGNVKVTNNKYIKTDNGVSVQLRGKNTEFVNNGIIELSNGSKIVEENQGNIKLGGIIKISDKRTEELKDFKIDSLVTGNIENNSMITDKNGIAIEQSEELNMAGDIWSSTINNLKENKIVLKTDNTAIKNDGVAILNKKIDFRTSVNSEGVTFEKGTLNFDANGKLKALKDTFTILRETQINKVGDNKDTFYLEKGSRLGLENTNINGANILGEGIIVSKKMVNIKGDVEAEEFDIEEGEVIIDGQVNISKIKVGQDSAAESDKISCLRISSNSSFGKETAIWNSLSGIKGTTIFDISSNGENALKNSTKKVTVSGNIDFDTTNLTSNTTVELNNKDKNVTHDLSGASYTNKTTGVYTTKLDTTENKNTLEFAYNRNLFKDARLNAINNEAQIVNDKFSQVESERESQIDKLYSGSIYAETVRASYDNLKLNERTILSLNNDVKAGEFRAEGKAIYGKDEYKREGVVGKYDVENETSGLLASLEYGLTDTTKTGLVFAGSKQDLDAASGNADGDLFYLGLYGVKSVGNYDFTAGLGYQLGKYEANNTAANVLGTDKYDTEAISGYVQAKYLGDLGRGLSIQPKVKLGYTYLKQDDVKDSYFGLTDAEVKTFDTELGADLVKTVKFEKSTLDIKLGTAFVKTFGDTDKAFKGQFFGAKTTSNQFDVLGAGLSENVLKFNLGAEVENENGFFYNGGFTYEFGSENMESYGANVGIGYRF